MTIKVVGIATCDTCGNEEMGGAFNTSKVIKYFRNDGWLVYAQKSPAQAKSVCPECWEKKKRERKEIQQQRLSAAREKLQKKIAELEEKSEKYV